MRFSEETREKLNRLTGVEVDFLDTLASDLRELVDSNVYDGTERTFGAKLNFSALTVDKRGKARMLPTTVPAAKVLLVPIHSERAGEIKGHVSMFAKIVKTDWDAQAVVKPDDALPHSVDALRNLDHTKINVFDGTAFGNGTVVRILYDSNKLASSAEARGYIDMVAAGGAFLADTLLFRLCVPEETGLRSENGYLPYFGELADPEADVIDLSDLTKLDLSVVEQALSLCIESQDKCGDYTTILREAMSQNPNFQPAPDQANEENS